MFGYVGTASFVCQYQTECICCCCCRSALHRCFQAVIDSGTKLSSVLADSYQCQVHSVRTGCCDSLPLGSDQLISLGFALGNDCSHTQIRTRKYNQLKSVQCIIRIKVLCN